jgi:hypothetical protein
MAVLRVLLFRTDVGAGEGGTEDERKGCGAHGDGLVRIRYDWLMGR